MRPAVGGGLSLIEAMHPDGRVGRHAIVGRGWPELAPEEGSDGTFDLVVVAPSAADLRTPGWFEGAARTSARVTRDGLVCVVGGAGVRARMRRRLEDQGLVAAKTLMALPRSGSPRVLVPIRRATVRYAAENFAYVGPWMCRVAASLARLQPAAQALPSGVLIARAPSARPLFQWLDTLAGDGPADVIAGRAYSGNVFLIRFGRGDGELPTTVTKLSHVTSATPFADVGPAARSAGAYVPEELETRTDCDRHTSVQTALVGRRAAMLLAERPQDVREVVERIGGWLERWHRATAREGRLTAELLSDAVLDPAEEVVARVGGLERYVAELRARCAAVQGSAVSLVAAHNDLTMANILVGPGREIGVVDWDKAEQRSLPLRDFYYALADAHAATSRYGDREAAFAECFVQRGSRESETAILERRVASAAGADARVADLCFDACWLQHARNELRAQTTPAPFLAILHRLGSQRSAYARQLLP